MKSQVITPSSRSLVQPSRTPKTFESVTLTNKVPVAEPKVELDPRLLSKACLNFDEQNQVARMTLQEINGLFEQISQVKTETQARKRN